MRPLRNRLSRRGRALVLAAAALAAAAAIVVQAADDESRPAPAKRPPPPAAVPPTGAPSFLTRLIPSRAEPPLPSGVPQDLGALARRLPVERKVAQVFLFGFQGKRPLRALPRALARLDLGGVVVEDRNFENAPQLSSLLADLKSRARARRHLPPLTMTAQEGGEGSALPALPPAQAPGELRSPAAGAKAARRGARALRRVGINGVLAPVIDVGLEDGGALGRRAFSDDPELVAEFATATVDAYERVGVMAAPKHFPGLGAASQATTDGPATVGLSVAELEDRDLLPFQAAFRAGAPAVVVSSALYAPDDFLTPASLSRAVTTDLLRRDLGFRGLAITDDLADPGVSASVGAPAAAVRALKAGADLVQLSGSPTDQQRAYAAVLNAVRSGEISRARLDEAAARVLTAKRRLGLVR